MTELTPVMFFGGPKHGQCMDIFGQMNRVDIPVLSDCSFLLESMNKEFIPVDQVAHITTYHRELVEFTIFNQVMRWYCFSVDASHPDYSAAVKAASTFSRFLVAAKGGEVYLRDMRVAAFMMAESHMAEDFITRRCDSLRFVSCGFTIAMKGIAMRGSHSA